MNPPAAGALAPHPRISYTYTMPSSDLRLFIEAPAWPDAWSANTPLALSYVLVGDPESSEPLGIVSLQDTADLIWRGLSREWIYWDPLWADGVEIPNDPEEWSEEARRRETTVEDLVAIMQSNAQRWGHWDLITALGQHGMAPERSRELLRQHGRTLVGAWLTDLRKDPSVHSVPGLLITNLRRGLTPPSLTPMQRR